MDIAFQFDASTISTDIAVSNGDFVTDAELYTAIVISLFTDRRAKEDDAVERGDDRRGWWGDTFPQNENDKIGSRLWLLEREKATQQTLIRARDYCIEATQWLVDDKVADRVEVQVEFVKRTSNDIPQTLGIKIHVYRPTGAKSFEYQYAWRQLNAI
jgi:phage gp46-like protein